MDSTFLTLAAQVGPVTDGFAFTMAPLWVLFLPLVAFVLLLAAGKRLDKGCDVVAILAMGVGFLLSLCIFAESLAHGGAAAEGGASSQAAPVVHNISWLKVGNITLTLGILVDNLSAFMSVVVTGLATLVLIYSIFYMKGDGYYRRYFAYMCFFCFAMLGVVFSSNLLMTFIFWELVGLGSYFLIGFWFDKPPVGQDPGYQKLKASYATGIDERYLSPAHAQKKAFVMNRIGDFGFLSGIMIFATTMIAAATQGNTYANGPLEFTNLYAAREAGVFNNIEIFGLHGETLLTLAGILTFMGAIGKSAQFPLHTWLADAMQGPTTGSSIIHAATMVAAGVYLTARIHPLLTTESMFFIAMIGGITAFLAATMAMVQWDIKAVLAYSTVSQLAYMMIGLGSGSYTAGVSHLFTHAVFKCMLFLCAGSVIHACHHLQDMNKMGGLRKKMPKTYLATLCGVLAITGVPFFSGFYSKDAIIASSIEQALTHPENALTWIPCILAILTAGLTAFYMFRLLFMTFHGEPRDQHVYDHAHESPAIATTPLLLLAVGCLGFWWSGHLIQWPGGGVPVPALSAQVEEHGEKASVGWIDHYVVSPNSEMAQPHEAKPEHPAVAEAGDAHSPAEEAHHKSHLYATVISIAMLLIGLMAAVGIYLNRALDMDLIIEQNPGTVGMLWELASQLWFFDRLYQDGIVPLAKWFSRTLARFDFGFVDRILVDGLWGWTTWMAGTLVRSMQAGRVSYYVGVTAGAVALIVLLLLLK